MRSPRKHWSSWIAFVLALQLVLSSTLTFAQPKPSAKGSNASADTQPQDLTAKGLQLFEDQQYEDSIQTLSAALLRPNNTKEQKIEIYRLLALNYITLNRKDEADNAVRGLLVVEPDYELPPNESPRFRDFFSDARAKWDAEGRPGLERATPSASTVNLRHGSPPSAEKGKSLELRAKLEDPEGQAASVKLYYRVGSRGEFREVAATLADGNVRARIPGASVKPPVLDYYFEVRDETGRVIAYRGGAEEPLRIAIPDGGGSSWVLPLAIGGGVLGAAAIVGALALAGVFESSSPSASNRGTATVTVNVGETGVRF